MEKTRLDFLSVVTGVFASPVTVLNRIVNTVNDSVEEMTIEEQIAELEKTPNKGTNAQKKSLSRIELMADNANNGRPLYEGINKNEPLVEQVNVDEESAIKKQGKQRKKVQEGKEKERE